MPGIIRLAKCCVCGKQEAERSYGAGWPAWAQFNGITMNGDENPMLCPKHMRMVADYIDDLSGGNQDGVD